MPGFLAGFGQGALDYSNQLNNQAYRNALLQLDRQNQALRTRQVLEELTEQQRQRQVQSLIAGAFSKPLSPVGTSAPSMLDMSPNPSGSYSPPSAGSPVSAPTIGGYGVGGALDLIARDESGGRNVPNYRFDPGHTASGLWQITDSTWNDIAPKVGAPQLSYPSSPMDRPIGEQAKVADELYRERGPAPWANFNAKLAADLKALPDDQRQQTSQTAVTAAGMLPPMMVGRAGADAIMARLVERVAGSDAPDDVKGAALMQLLPLMSQEAQRQFQNALEVIRVQMQGTEFGVRQRETEATREATQAYRQETLDLRKLQAAQGKGADWQIVQTPDGRTLRVNRATGETGPVDLPAGTGKMGAAAGPEPSQDVVDTWAKVLEKGGSMPPGLSRTAAGSKLVQRVMTKMSADMAGQGGPEAGAGNLIANIGGQKANETSLRNMQKMADAATGFENTARLNFDKALSLAPTAVPTDLGPFFNRYIEEGETMFGDPNVPPYVAAMMTAANEYAKIMSGATGSVGSTVDSRKEARELFSPYLSLPQIKNVVEVAKVDMDNRMASNFGQIERIKQRMRSPGTAPPEATGGRDATQPQGGNLDATPEQYEKLPAGAAYTVPGDPTVRYKQ